MRKLGAVAIAAALGLAGASAAQAEPAGANLVEVLKGKSAAEFNALVAKLPKSQQAQALKAVRIDPRILGGTSADISKFPWQVALIKGYAPPSIRSQFCGGSLIAPDVVLTAAHCIDNEMIRGDASRVDIVAGSAFYGSGGERLKVQAVFVHPQWSDSSMDYDFAILKLAAPSQLGAPAKLAEASPFPPTMTSVSGWGALSEGGRGSDELLYVDVPIVSTEECNKPESYNGEVTPRMICAGLREGGLDSCQGDSGGPLVNTATRELVGVVSFGHGCGRALKYGIYSRVSVVVPWIRGFSAPHAITIAHAAGPANADR